MDWDVIYGYGRVDQIPMLNLFTLSTLNWRALKRISIGLRQLPSYNDALTATAGSWQPPFTIPALLEFQICLFRSYSVGYFECGLRPEWRLDNTQNFLGEAFAPARIWGVEDHSPREFLQLG
jgi:hypothetical protein